MNSLNILSARVIGQIAPENPVKIRARSYSDGSLYKADPASKPKRSASQHIKEHSARDEDGENWKSADQKEQNVVETTNGSSDELSEKTLLLPEKGSSQSNAVRCGKLQLAAKRLVNVLTASLKWVLSTLASPGVYIVTGFYDDKGKFSLLIPVRKLCRSLSGRNGSKSTAQAVGLSGSNDIAKKSTEEQRLRRNKVKESRSKNQSYSWLSPATSESEADAEDNIILLDSPPSSRPPFKSSSSSEDTPQTRRSIRIKLNNEDTDRRRKQRREKDVTSRNAAPGTREQQPSLTVSTIKSPTSATSTLKLTKYPYAPAPPQPLVPRRQPSYSAQTPRSSRFTQKTLVIDLDETLIHSLAKGGRMSSGHMVEVKLNTIVGIGGATLAPQHPILYYVHKRPHCDDFLRNVCKWYNLVVFTASVQEYADPVIDWLEQERKYFSARYYRQHCTFRNGAYIKDLSSVEPDLSKVMILDNSPLSYIFHEGKNREID